MNTQERQPRISVIVPVYRVENYLVECLNSILSQTLKDLEVFLIDEGEEDRSQQIIDEYASHDERIIAVHDKNGGYGNAVNRGFAMARGQYVAIVESDDFIEPTMYEELYQYAQNTGADFVKCQAWKYEDRGANRMNRAESNTLLPFADFITKHVPQGRCYQAFDYPAQLAAHPSIWAGIYKREFLVKNKIYFAPKGAYLDTYFNMRLYLSRGKAAWYPKPFYHWRVTNPTATNARWDLAEALKRWEEIHSLFDKDKESLWRKIAPYTIHEELLQCFVHIMTRPYCDMSQYRKMYNTFSLYYLRRDIKESPVLDKNERKYFAYIKEHNTIISIFMLRCMWIVYKILGRK